MKILGIESSCDETAAAVVEDGFRLLSNVVVSQIDIHKAYGGVVPEVAARSHIEAINPVIDEALAKANCTWDDIDAIAVTLEVSKLDRSKVVRLEHPWNILLIVFTFEVLNELTFNFFNDLQFLNIPP